MAEGVKLSRSLHFDFLLQLAAVAIFVFVAEKLARTFHGPHNSFPVEMIIVIIFALISISVIGNFLKVLFLERNVWLVGDELWIAAVLGRRRRASLADVVSAEMDERRYRRQVTELVLVTLKGDRRFQFAMPDRDANSELHPNAEIFQSAVRRFKPEFTIKP